MGSLKFLIWIIGENIDSIHSVFQFLNLRYGFKKIEIVGVIGDKALYLNNTKLRNISPDSIHLAKYDYIMAIGLNSDITSDNIAMKKFLAEKINISDNLLIFDFEILNGTFYFSNVCLVIIFNHRFDRNLPLLRKIYGERFSNVRFLVPFYDGDDDDVIAVYESSHQFQGYLIQAYDKLKNIQCTHYLFIGDDLIINPNFNETNFIDKTSKCSSLDLDFSICGFSHLNSSNSFRWYWTIGSSKPFYNSSTNWHSSLYSYDEAIEKFNKFFQTKYPEVYSEEFFGDPNESGTTMFGSWNDANEFRDMVRRFVVHENRNSLKIPYPMARGYSDIFCIKKEQLFKFSRICGIFSAMNLFVEIAIPTAVVLTFQRENVSFFPGKCTSVLWGEDRIKLENKYNRDFNKLYNEWDKNLYFIHPIKLSAWNIRI